jgi:hypothetical protein
LDEQKNITEEFDRKLKEKENEYFGLIDKMNVKLNTDDI